MEIIQITKHEAKLLNEMGVSYGSGGISHTYTSHKRYYLCESKVNMNLIKKIRNKNIA